MRCGIRLIVVGVVAVTVLGGAVAVYAGTSVGGEFTEGSPNRGRITQMAQSGLISALSDRSATVVSYDGFAQTYALSAHTTITEQPQRSDRASANSLRVGDWVLIEALRTATGPVATSVRKGATPMDLLIAPSGSR